MTAQVTGGDGGHPCMIFDHDGAEVARHQLGHEQILPRAQRVATPNAC